MTDALNTPNAADGWLDQLVDGELNHDQQRQLLLSLEGQPDGWRRCALAFLEAQTWRRELPTLVPDAADKAASRLSIAGSNRMNNSHRTRWLAIAASLLVAFGIGITARSWWQGEASPAGQQPMLVANSDNNAAPPSKQESLRVTLPSADGTSQQTVDVPLIEANDENWETLLAQNEPVLSDLALQTLESTGHQVQQHRAYYPVQLEDGRQAVVPLDYIEVKYTGSWQ